MAWLDFVKKKSQKSMAYAHPMLQKKKKKEKKKGEIGQS